MNKKKKVLQKIMVKILPLCQPGLPTLRLPPLPFVHVLSAPLPACPPCSVSLSPCPLISRPPPFPAAHCPCARRCFDFALTSFFTPLLPFPCSFDSSLAPSSSLCLFSRFFTLPITSPFRYSQPPRARCGFSRPSSPPC